MSTNGINNIGYPASEGEWPKPNRPAQRIDATDTPNLVIRADHAAVIRKALQLNDLNPAALEDARIEIEQNTLDTPENIRIAAENILKFGL